MRTTAKEAEAGKKYYRAGGLPGIYYEKPKTSKKIVERIIKRGEGDRGRKNISYSVSDDALISRLANGHILFRMVRRAKKKGGEEVRKYVALPPDYPLNDRCRGG